MKSQNLLWKEISIDIISLLRRNGSCDNFQNDPNNPIDLPQI